jgi:cell division septation protein DedD
VSIGVLLILTLLALLYTRDAAVAPVAEQNASDGASVAESLPKAGEPGAGRLITGVGAATGNITPAGGKLKNYPQEKNVTDSTAMNLVNQGSASARVSHAPYTVQVGSFRNAASAAGLVARLESRGYLAFVNIAKQGASAFGKELKQREPFITGFIVAVKK